VIGRDQEFTVKQKLGACIYDLPNFLWEMRPSSSSPWIRIRNRDESLLPGKNNLGVECGWRWTTDLHIAKVFPRTGLWLMKRALRDWPIELRPEPAVETRETSPVVSFIIGHRGTERLPHLLATLGSIAAQVEIPCECILIEQSNNADVKDQLPSWVNYIHTLLPYSDMPYSRAWAFNVGARAARGEILVFHDNDMLAPVDYAREIVARAKEGYEVINLKRFIFYFGQSDSSRLFATGALETEAGMAAIMQNAFGGSVAVLRSAFFSIGGFDESFAGWGGEDNELWERAATRACWPYGYLPFVHVWHAPQTEKLNTMRPTVSLYEERSAIPPAERIAELSAREFGDTTAPHERSFARMT